MTTDIHLVEEPKPMRSMNAKKFALWLFMVSIGMLFAALTSAYIVREGDGNWREVELPVELWLTSAIILLSSVTMHWAYRSAKKDNLNTVKIAMTLTVILGGVFLAGQWYVWQIFVKNNVYFVDPETPSGSFLYVLTGVHAAHIISGVIFLIIVLIATYRYKVHSKNLNQISMCASYWHFLDGLWLYLFVFLLLNH